MSAIDHGTFYARPGAGGDRRLIVFTHGITALGESAQLRTWRYRGLLGRLLHESGAPFDRADFLPFEFENHRRAKTDLDEKAGELAREIQQRHLARGYQGVYL